MVDFEALVGESIKYSDGPAIARGQDFLGGFGSLFHHSSLENAFILSLLLRCCVNDLQEVLVLVELSRVSHWVHGLHR